MSEKSSSRMRSLVSELNRLWLSSAKEALLLDREAAILAFGLSYELANLILAMTPGTLLRFADHEARLFRIGLSEQAFRVACEPDVSEQIRLSFIQSVLTMEDHS